MRISRRAFLKTTLIGTAFLAGSKYFKIGYSESSKEEELRIIRSTCSPNCTGACGFHATVHHGRLVTLIQAADYPESEYNPRGCLKGQSMMNLIYGPDRLKQPLIRVGKRGEGKFKAVSWDEALDYAATRLVEIMKKYGPDSIASFIQVPGTGYVQKGALMRLSSLYGWSIIHAYTMNGDLPIFWPMTFGVQTEELESLEWANSKYTMICGSNILWTRVPDAKFLHLSRERGGKIVVVDPNYSPTAALADEWIQINPSTDSAFALGLAWVILSERLYEEEFIKTYTDLPLLVRLDNKKKLKAEDVAELSSQAKAMKVHLPEYRELYVMVDSKSKRLAIPDPENLKPKFDPLLEGEIEVTLVTGERVKTKPVFQLIKEEILNNYSPEKVAKIIVPFPERVKEYEEMIKRIGKEIGIIKPLHIIYGASNYQWYHGDLKGRAYALLVTLTGNLGKSGAGISTYAGQYRVRWPLGAWWQFKEKPLKWTNFLLWLNKEFRESKEFKKYNKEIPYPTNGIKALVFGWGNPFDQHNLANRLKEMASSGELELIINLDFQMTTSVAWSDVILPGVTWYEKYDLTATVLHPYVQLQQPAIEPLFHCMPEIWILKELAKKIAEKLGNENFMEEIREFYVNPELFDKEEEARRKGQWSLKLARDLAHQASLDAAELMLKTGGSLVEGITVELLKNGPVRLNLPTPNRRQLVFYEQIQEFKPFPPVSFPAPLPKTARFVKSGRIEFYKDEDVFIDLEETLPIHKDPLKDTEYKLSQKKYSLFYITRNVLYRVHSTHSNNITMLELQNFRARIWIHPETAKIRGLKENDFVEVYNDRGKVYGYVIFDPGLHPQVVIFEEGWWSRYLRDTSYNSLIEPWIKPSHIIYFVPGIWEPTTCWNEASCEIRKV